MVLQQQLSGRELPRSTATVVPPGTAVQTAKSMLRAVCSGSAATAATKALLASLDSGEGFDPAEWQAQRVALLASPTRRRALEDRRAAISKGQSECT